MDDSEAEALFLKDCESHYRPEDFPLNIPLSAILRFKSKSGIQSPEKHLEYLRMLNSCPLFNCFIFTMKELHNNRSHTVHILKKSKRLYSSGVVELTVNDGLLEN
jgi:hypothetical protein